MSINLIMGVDNIDKLDKIHNMKINQIFCGYIDSYAKKKWTEELCIVNKRGSNCNIFGIKNFKNFADKCKQYNISVHVTFNTLYTPEQYKWVLDAIDKVSKFDAIKGIIVSDIGLLLRLKEKKYKKDIVISNGASVFNSSAVSFYKQFNVNRIILNRQTKSNEIVKILKKHKDMNFEIFLLLGNCMFADGFCSLFHKTGKKNYGIANCGLIYDAYNKNDYAILKSRRKNIIKKDLNNYRSIGCNLCLIKKLKKYSNRITYKLVTRSNYLNEFDRIEELLPIIKNLDTTTYDIKDLYLKLFNKKCDGYGCYISDKIV